MPPPARPRRTLDRRRTPGPGCTWSTWPKLVKADSAALARNSTDSTKNGEPFLDSPSRADSVAPSQKMYLNTRVIARG